MKFAVVPRAEQYTEITIDYLNREIVVFCNKRQIIRRLVKRVKAPFKEQLNDAGEVISITYKLDFADKNLKKILSITTLLGSMRVEGK